MTSYKEGEVLGPEVPGEREARERLRFLAWLLDSSIQIPGTRFTVGLDALIGLLPFLGDLIGVLVSSFIVAEARRLGASRSVLARMAFNVAVEGLVGLIPFAGDVFDAAWKANQRNVRLLEHWTERPRRAERASTFFVAMVVLGIVAFAAVTVSLTYLLLRWLVS
jgi:branched-subunit amino acid ABC-type transport system permease component